MAAAGKDANEPVRKRPPATTPQARENQLISLAYDEAERQIRSKTASSQVITHFLKLGTAREMLDREKIASENKLLEARVKAMASTEAIEAVYTEALNAFRGYRGEDPEDEFID